MILVGQLFALKEAVEVSEQHASLLSADFAVRFSFRFVTRVSFAASFVSSRMFFVCFSVSLRVFRSPFVSFRFVSSRVSLAFRFFNQYSIENNLSLEKKKPVLV